MNRDYGILRLTFSHIAEGNTLCCRTEQNKPVSVCLQPFQKYITEFLTPGCRLNAVEWRKESGQPVVCELLVLNPDYLVDITTVAGCFESYGSSPLVSIIRKIQPDSGSQAIILGNFAGEILDRTVRENSDSPAGYADMAEEFFRRSALDIAAADDFNSAAFHNEAKNQLANIRKAIHGSIPGLLPGISAEEMILEPTFFCEPLGLQGRMDLITSDFRMIVEQKSGKGEFGSGDTSPLAKYPHRIQLLLYRAILHYAFNIPSDSLNSFLLYSRYPEPLVMQRDMTETLRGAIEVRNRIVAIEERLASQNGYAVLDSLTPEKINPSGSGGKLWRDYTYPALKKLLDLYHLSPETERLYVRRMLEFTAREHLFSKCGFNEILIKGGFSSSWTIPLRQRLEQGQIYIGLSISSLSKDSYGKVNEIALNLPEDALTDAANFRTGDIVALYSYSADAVPDIRDSFIIRATIRSFSEKGIILRLRSPQPEKLFGATGRLWAVEPDFYESSFRHIYRGIYSLLNAPAKRRKEFLYPSGRTSAVPYTLKGDYGSLNEAVTRAMSAEGTFAIIGPPGTGKTSFGLVSLLKEELLNEGHSVLLTAYTNRAVDEICSKLVEKDIQFIRIGSSVNCDPVFREYLLENILKGCRNIDELKETIGKTRVFAGTVHAVTGSSLLRIRSFSLAVIDEASQISEPQILGLFAAADSRKVPAIGRFILIGDHKQLPSVVLQDADTSVITDPPLNKIGLYDCRDSFFERFLRMNRLKDGSYNPCSVFMFTRQGRMHRDVASFASENFYNGNLKPLLLPHQDTPVSQKKVYDSEIGNLLNSSRTIFIDVKTDGTFPGNINPAEAEMAARVAREIYMREAENFNPDTTLGIIVPYRMQGAAIRSILHGTGIPELEKVTIDTVERFQGSQRDYIVYSTVATRRQQLMFLTSCRFTDSDGSVIDRKLNVALTRAKNCNIIIGNKSTLSADPIYSRLIGGEH